MAGGPETGQLGVSPRPGRSCSHSNGIISILQMYGDESPAWRTVCGLRGWTQRGLERPLPLSSGLAGHHSWLKPVTRPGHIQGARNGAHLLPGRVKGCRHFCHLPQWQIARLIIRGEEIRPLLKAKWVPLTAPATSSQGADNTLASCPHGSHRRVTSDYAPDWQSALCLSTCLSVRAPVHPSVHVLQETQEDPPRAPRL